MNQLYCSIHTNPFLPKDVFVPQTPGPGAYDPIQVSKNPAAPVFSGETYHRNKQLAEDEKRKKRNNNNNNIINGKENANRKHVPGPGSYTPHVVSSDKNISVPLMYTSSSLRQQQNSSSEVRKKCGKCSSYSAVVQNDGSAPGPGAYNPHTYNSFSSNNTLTGNTMAPRWDKIGSYESGPRSHLVAKNSISFCHQTVPPPTAYNPTIIPGNVSAPCFRSSSVYDPQRAKTVYNSFVDSRKKRISLHPWRLPSQRKTTTKSSSSSVIGSPFLLSPRSPNSARTERSFAAVSAQKIVNNTTNDGINVSKITFSSLATTPQKSFI